MEAGRKYFNPSRISMLIYKSEWAQRARPSDGLMVKEK